MSEKEKKIIHEIDYLEHRDFYNYCPYIQIEIWKFQIEAGNLFSDFFFSASEEDTRQKIQMEREINEYVKRRRLRKSDRKDD